MPRFLSYVRLNYFFLISEMIVPGSTYWNVAVGREKGEVLNDAEGMDTVKNLARNMAWLMKRLAIPENMPKGRSVPA
jgi:hypothetical protein